MATNVILPALGMAQETGKIIRWLKSEGELVRQGEPLVEIETDKAAVELEAPATGIVVGIVAASDDEIPVGQTIAQIVEPGSMPQSGENGAQKVSSASSIISTEGATRASTPVSPLAARIAAEHHLNIEEIQPIGKRILKDDVLSYLQRQGQPVSTVQPESGRPVSAVGLLAASPKARRLAQEQGKDLATIHGSGPDGAILAVDVLAASLPVPAQVVTTAAAIEATSAELHELVTGRTWRLMAERTTQSWTSVPHFFLQRDVNASRLMVWREYVQKRTTEKIT